MIHPGRQLPAPWERMAVRTEHDGVEAKDDGDAEVDGDTRAEVVYAARWVRTWVQAALNTLGLTCRGSQS